MTKMIILLSATLLTACTTLTCNVSGSGNTVNIEQPKSVSASPYLKTGDNHVSMVP